MDNLQAVDLNANWQCEYADEDVPMVVPALNQWGLDHQARASCWLRHVFLLTALDFCVSYLLMVDSAPEQAQIYVNGERIGVFGAASFEADITNFVALGENELAFWVASPSSGAFNGVRLQPVPCE
ncbi:MAG: hypothetical protein K8L99_23405 [Anaerolineae bacterium]|nr:hypothetical protein [Anaerolineae bacterium]